MDMQGQRVLHVTQAQAWEALNDPEILKSCLPGCDKFELTQDNVYSIGMGIKIGPVSAKFAGKVTLSDIQAPNAYKLHFEAQGGVAGFGKGESHVSLHPHNEGCELKYTVHSTVGGKLAQLGQRLIDGAAKSIAEDFFKRFDEALQAKYPRTDAVSSPAIADVNTSSGSVPKWVWLALVVGAVAIWSLVR
ncbi:MAG: carbon monoxide dehydrogenase [Betaproteobacteria bacterium]|nr:carbon monoxide dehydrogenase [Betaproteobacteria bacterium]